MNALSARKGFSFAGRAWGERGRGFAVQYLHGMGGGGEGFEDPSSWPVEFIRVAGRVRGFSWAGAVKSDIHISLRSEETLYIAGSINTVELLIDLVLEPAETLRQYSGFENGREALASLSDPGLGALWQGTRIADPASESDAFVLRSPDSDALSLRLIVRDSARGTSRLIAIRAKPIISIESTLPEEPADLVATYATLSAWSGAHFVDATNSLGWPADVPVARPSAVVTRESPWIRLGISLPIVLIIVSVIVGRFSRRQVK